MRLVLEISSGNLDDKLNNSVWLYLGALTEPIKITFSELGEKPVYISCGIKLPARKVQSRSSNS